MTTLSLQQIKMLQVQVLEALADNSVEKLKSIYQAAPSGFDINSVVEEGETALFKATRRLRPENIPVIEFLLQNGAKPTLVLGAESTEVLDRNALINIWEEVVSGLVASFSQEGVKRANVFPIFKLAHEKSHYTAQENTQLLTYTLLLGGAERDQVIDYFLTQPIDLSYSFERGGGPINLALASLNSSSTNVWIVEKLCARDLSTQEKQMFIQAYQQPLYYDNVNRQKLDSVIEKLKLELEIEKTTATPIVVHKIKI